MSKDIQPTEEQRKIAWALGLDAEKLADQVALNQREPRERGEFVSFSTQDLARRSVVFNTVVDPNPASDDLDALVQTMVATANRAAAANDNGDGLSLRAACVIVKNLCEKIITQVS